MITERFKAVVLKELKLKDFELYDEMSAAQVPGWDSLTHANIIMALEREYKVRLTNKEILNVENVGELQKLVESKITGNL